MIRSQVTRSSYDRAEDGEEFVDTGWSGYVRWIRHVLMICDAEKAIGIAGIMGGENSMITDDVQTMLFEAACFNGTNIRLSAKRDGSAYRCFR